MADATHIEWTDATWNIVTGCSVVSPGCTNCYAMRLAGTRLKHHPSRKGLTIDSKAGPVWNGQVRFNAEWLTQPLRWTRPRRIFVAAHGDLFHDGVTDDQLDQIFAVMALCPQHTFQILTKRPERMRAYLTDETRRGHAGAKARIREAAEGLGREAILYSRWPLPNVWLGVSVEDQTRAVERVSYLLNTPAAVRWVSAEPLLGPVDFSRLRFSPACNTIIDALRPHRDPFTRQLGRIDWVVAGGESGPGARPMHPDWARQLRDQCAAGGVAFLFKQWGAFAPAIMERNVMAASANIAWPDGTVGGGSAEDHGGEGTGLLTMSKKQSGRLLDGELHDAYPEARS